MTQQGIGMAQELQELREYKKRARYVMAKLHNEKDEQQEMIEKLSKHISQLETKVMSLQLQLKNATSNVKA